MPISYRFRWIPFIATLVVMAIGFSLGQWQMRRAAAKEAIEIKMSARGSAPVIALNSAVPDVGEMEFRRVKVKGEFVRDWPVYLNNRPLHSAAGFYLLMPFKIENSGHYILVARGWLPRNALQLTKLPALITPAGQVEIEGVIRHNPGRLMQFGIAEKLQPYAIVQNADVEAFAAASKLTMLPFLLEQSGDTGNVKDGLVRDWPRPSSGIDKHYGYAFQWYGLTAMALLFFLVTGFRRGTK